MLTVIINPDDHEHSATFAVPRILLTQWSDFFKAACRREWKEATSRVIKIPDVHVDVFHWYLDCEYRSNAPVGCLRNVPFQSAAEAEPTLYHLVEL